jgi:hypothetical protein
MLLHEVGHLFGAEGAGPPPDRVTPPPVLIGGGGGVRPQQVAHEALGGDERQQGKKIAKYRYKIFEKFREISCVSWGREIFVFRSKKIVTFELPEQKATEIRLVL